MALILCDVCKSKISDKSKNCPNCGRFTRFISGYARNRPQVSYAGENLNSYILKMPLYADDIADIFASLPNFVKTIAFFQGYARGSNTEADSFAEFCVTEIYRTGSAFSTIRLIKPKTFAGISSAEMRELIIRYGTEKQEAEQVLIEALFGTGKLIVGFNLNESLNQVYKILESQSKQVLFDRAHFLDLSMVEFAKTNSYRGLYETAIINSVDIPVKNRTVADAFYAHRLMLFYSAEIKDFTGYFNCLHSVSETENKLPSITYGLAKSSAAMLAELGAIEDASDTHRKPKEQSAFGSPFSTVQGQERELGGATLRRTVRGASGALKISRYALESTQLFSIYERNSNLVRINKRSVARGDKSTVFEKRAEKFQRIKRDFGG